MVIARLVTGIDGCRDGGGPGEDDVLRTLGSEPGCILLAFENEEIHMLQVRIPLRIPPLGIHNTHILGRPGHPPVNGNLKVKGDVAGRGGLERICVTALDAESRFDEEGILLEAVDSGLLGIQEDNRQVRIQGHLLFFSACV